MKKVPPPHGGGKWYVNTVREILKRPEYRGDFSYNAKKSGQFHVVNGKYEVVAVSQYQDDEEKSHPWAVTTKGDRQGWCVQASSTPSCLMPPKRGLRAFRSRAADDHAKTDTRYRVSFL